MTVRDALENWPEAKQALQDARATFFEVVRHDFGLPALDAGRGTTA